MFCCDSVLMRMWVCSCLQAIVELQSEKYVHIIDEEEALQLNNNDKSLFVFSDFTSTAFERCREVCVTSCTHTYELHDLHLQFPFIFSLRHCLYLFI